MPLLLTHRLRLIETTCDTCKQASLCVSAEVEHSRTTGSTDPICLSCLQVGEVEVFLSLEPPTYASGARAPTKAMKRTADHRELKLSKIIGGRKQLASGSLPHAKGDVVRRGEWVGDDKTCRTVKKGYRLTLEFLTKIRSWCKGQEKFFITIGFLNPITHAVDDEVVVIDRHVFEERFFSANKRR